MVATIIMSSRLLVSAFLLTILPFSNSCKKMGGDDKLTMIKQSYTGSQLKLNGYYYQGTNYYSVYFFYNDGTLLYGDGGFTYQELTKHEAMYINEVWLMTVKSYKDYWGLFKIVGNTIAFERWYPSSGGPYPAYIRSGEILNDTTFRITQSMRSDGSEVRAKDEIYHFKQFSPKPDSTNSFVP